MEDKTLASDSERDLTLDRLSTAQAEGRLTLEEFQSRLSAALQARTRGQLQELTSDLPAPEHVTSVSADDTHDPEVGFGTHLGTHSEPPREKNPQAIVEALHPRGMRVSWIVWAVVSAANLLVWLMVSLGSNANVYPWFFWVAGPWGFALLVHTLNSRGSRHDTGSIAPAGTLCHTPQSDVQGGPGGH